MKYATPNHTHPVLWAKPALLVIYLSLRVTHSRSLYVLYVCVVCVTYLDKTRKGKKTCKEKALVKAILEGGWWKTFAYTPIKSCISHKDKIATRVRRL